MNRKKRKAPNNSGIPPACFLLLAIFCCHFLPLYAETESEKAIFGFINEDRKRENLAPLIWDEKLYAVALEHSKDMAEMAKVSHAGSDRTQPHERIQRGGIYASKIAENVARDVNVISAHTSLMESLYHRENILDPGATHVAVAVVPRNQYLYVTELFIHKLNDYSLEDARRKLLQEINDFRAKQGLNRLALSQTLSRAAQSHVDVQRKLSDLSQPLLSNLLARQLKGPVRINVYTTADLQDIPSEARENLKFQTPAVGIGFDRIRGHLCESGCYLVTLIFGPPNET